jgi:DNA-binding beta-propeller fold protein YncE
VNRRELLRTGLVAASAALVDPWSYARPAANAARGGLALVTADTEAHVVALSLSSGAIRARLATLEGPRSIESAPGAQALVAHTSQGAVSLLEGIPPRVRRVLRGFAQPRYSAVQRDGRYAYVSDSGNGELAVVDLVRGRVVRRVAVGALARHLTLSPNGRTLWVSLGSSAAAIAVVDVSDAARPRLHRVVHPPFLAHDVAFAPGGSLIWVTAGRARQIAVYRPGRARPELLLDADAPPQHVSFRGALAYVASGDSGTLQVRRAADGRIRRTTRIPLGSYNVQAAAVRVLTPSLARGIVTVLDGDGRVDVSVRVARAVHDACVIG